MSIVFPVILIVAVLLIFAFLQLASGTFSLFYHFMLGRFSTKKADSLSLSFIFGVELYLVAMWLSIFIILYAICLAIPDYKNHIFLWTLTGISFAEAIALFCFYYRKPRSQKSTELFISRTFVANIQNRISAIKYRRDAFALGFFIGVPELIFTLPLFVITNIILLNTTLAPATSTIILAIIAGLLPLFIIRAYYRTGHTLADIQRARIKLKPYVRFILPLAYIAIALILIYLGI